MVSKYVGFTLTCSFVSIGDESIPKCIYNYKIMQAQHVHTVSMHEQALVSLKLKNTIDAEVC